MPEKHVSLFRTAFQNKCPACGKGDIYGKLLEVVVCCDECGQRLKEHDAGDGPVFFAMFFASIIITVLAVMVEIFLMIPLWLHIIIWFPATICLSIVLLKIIKSWLIGMQYRHNVGGFRDQ